MKMVTLLIVINGILLKETRECITKIHVSDINLSYKKCASPNKNYKWKIVLANVIHQEIKYFYQIFQCK